MRVVMLRVLNTPLLYFFLLEIFYLPLDPAQQITLMLDLLLDCMQKIIVVLRHVDLALLDCDWGAAEALLLQGELLL